MKTSEKHLGVGDWAAASSTLKEATIRLELRLIGQAVNDRRQWVFSLELKYVIWAVAKLSPQQPRDGGRNKEQGTL